MIDTIEAWLRADVVFWPVGESRLWLWASVLIVYTVVSTVIAGLVGRAGGAIVRLFAGPGSGVR